MARADLFALTSRWEGLGLVIVEAMALGTPVVATDCPSGPRELLDHGRLGKLVPVGDDQALAAAMQQALAEPPLREAMQQATAAYTVAASADAYLAAMGLAPHAAQANSAV
jgi:glycosyltransferase involved in cell wall biosynthesis